VILASNLDTNTESEAITGFDRVCVRRDIFFAIDIRQFFRKWRARLDSNLCPRLRRADLRGGRD